MRNISAAGLAKIATKYGNEPIVIVEIDWGGGTPMSYADRDIGTILGRILEIGNLDNVIGVSNSDSSQSIDLILDDTDGTIKGIFNTRDIHKRTVRVYQWFEGLALTDKFLLFAGKISTPIVWNERDRTVKFTVLSQLEDKEVGFSAEEGQFPYLPSDLVGKAWPMIFGTVQDCPALQINHAVTGTTLSGVGIISREEEYANSPLFADGNDIDQGAACSIASAGMQISQMSLQRDCFIKIGDIQQAEAMQRQIESSYAQLSSQSASSAAQISCAQAKRDQQIADAKKGLGLNPVRILGGEDFPQGVVVTIDIGGGQFTGTFNGQYFYISSRYDPNADTSPAEEADTCGSEPTSCQAQWLISQTPCGELTSYGPIGIGSAPTKKPANPMIQSWYDAGSSVKLLTGKDLTYIVSITPGKVLAVKAYKQFTGEQRLIDVPSNLYRVEIQNYGSITATQIVFPKALSTILGPTVIDPEVIVGYPDNLPPIWDEAAQAAIIAYQETLRRYAEQPTPASNINQGWSDDIYVTYEATAPEYGPNIIDILKHLIVTYTGLTYDATTFNAVKPKLVNFPANFPILERKNTLTVLQEIAYQARCALWLADGVFYIKYLPEEPATDDTFTVSDLDADSGIEVELTSTEDLVTRMEATWRVSWAPGPTDREKDKSEKLMILRHNITRYGTMNENYFWYIYNQPDIIYKCATFWLIRKSNTWKKIKFSSYLQKLNLETFDTVNLNLSTNYVASSAVKAVVDSATYNSVDNVIDFTCLVPVRSGEMTLYPYYWPATLETTVAWPPAEDILTGDAGGGGIGMDATGTLPIGDTTNIDQTSVVWVGGPNVVYRAQSDLGDRTPTDKNFVPQPITNTSAYGELSPEGKPYVNTSMYQVKPRGTFTLNKYAPNSVIDIRKTLIVDSWYPQGKSSRLGSVFYGIDDAGKLQIDLYARVADSDHPDTAAHLNDVLHITDDSENLALRLESHVISTGEITNDTGTTRLSQVLTTADNKRLALLDGASVITKLGDSYTSKLEDVLIPNAGNLCIDATAYIHDGTNPDKEFDFKFDSDGGKFGAGTAFLQD